MADAWYEGTVSPRWSTQGEPLDPIFRLTSSALAARTASSPAQMGLWDWVSAVS
jgi:hypothetical protein